MEGMDAMTMEEFHAWAAEMDEYIASFENESASHHGAVAPGGEHGPSVAQDSELIAAPQGGHSVQSSYEPQDFPPNFDPSFGWYFNTTSDSQPIASSSTAPTPALPTTMNTPSAYGAPVHGNASPAKYTRSQLVVEMPQYVRPPRGITITAEEILTFCPRWTVSPEVASRFQSNGITIGMAVDTQLKAINRLGDVNEKQKAINRMKQDFAQGGRLFFNCLKWKKQIAIDHGQDDDLTANDWHTRDEHAIANGIGLDGKTPGPQKNQWVDIPLSRSFTNVPLANFPTGRGRGTMTVCLEAIYHYPAHMQNTLTTADWGWIVESIKQSGNGIALVAAGPGQNLV
ncbi:hypothetical protein CBER1_05039 [Cercospora berteroae]|uniref:Uncharacterized protein n=1 Tax=Cercospora berteroae TaxID=357750 RepID=A0A2S6BRG8_9PEZI|nr:hypothetical protein CBER1_05039 [Cercospora berteroae]